MSDLDGVRFEVRAEIDDAVLSRLLALAFGVPYRLRPWRSQLVEHSLSWVTAYNTDRDLVGFVNVAWDGGVHAFLLDPMVHPSARRSGLGTALVQRASHEAAGAGCTWLHVDFDPELSRFYLGSCGFQATTAGLLRLTGRDRN